MLYTRYLILNNGYITPRSLIIHKQIIKYLDINIIKYRLVES